MALSTETKQKLKNMFAPLLMEKKDDKWRGSIGRWSWWAVLGPALYTWASNFWLEDVQDIAPNHLTVLLVLATYNLGKKVTSFLGSYYENKKTDAK